MWDVEDQSEADVFRVFLPGEARPVPVLFDGLLAEGAGAAEGVVAEVVGVNALGEVADHVDEAEGVPFMGVVVFAEAGGEAAGAEEVPLAGLARVGEPDELGIKILAEGEAGGRAGAAGVEPLTGGGDAKAEVRDAKLDVAGLGEGQGAVGSVVEAASGLVTAELVPLPIGEAPSSDEEGGDIGVFISGYEVEDDAGAAMADAGEAMGEGLASPEAGAVEAPLLVVEAARDLMDDEVLLLLCGAGPSSSIEEGSEEGVGAEESGAGGGEGEACLLVFGVGEESALESFDVGHSWQFIEAGSWRPGIEEFLNLLFGVGVLREAYVGDVALEVGCLGG